LNAGKIEILDLRNPVLADIQRAALSVSYRRQGPNPRWSPFRYFTARFPSVIAPENLLAGES
jgi:hypothetical protein